MKNKILVHNGIVSDIDLEKKPSVLTCFRCKHINGIDYQYSSSCSYPLVPSAFEQLKEEENSKIKSLELKYEQDIKSMREEMNQRFTQIMSMIQQNSQLAYIKPEALTTKKVMNT